MLTRCRREQSVSHAGGHENRPGKPRLLVVFSSWGLSTYGGPGLLHPHQEPDRPLSHRRQDPQRHIQAGLAVHGVRARGVGGCHLWDSCVASKANTGVAAWGADWWCGWEHTHGSVHTHTHPLSLSLSLSLCHCLSLSLTLSLSSADCVQDDMWLMFDNCFSFNRQGSFHHRYCQRVSAACCLALRIAS
jgi:hypothetical protein